MKIFKKAVALCMITLLSMGAVACNSKATDPNDTAKTQDSSDKTVIAKVGDKEIYKSNFDEQMTSLDSMIKLQFGEDYANNAEAMAYYDSQKQEIINYLIETEVLLQKAVALKIEAPAEEIKTELDATKASFESEEAFNTALKENNLTLAELEENIKNNLLISKIISQYTEDVTVTDKEIEDYYNQNLATYSTAPGAQMAHVLLATEEEAKKAKEAYDSGKSTFEALAAEHNTDSTKDLGGALGFVPYDSTSYDPDFLAGAKDLTEGEVSNPVKSQFGWHLIKTTDIQTETIPQPLEEVKETIKSNLQYEKQFQKLTEYLTTWKEELKVEIFEDKLK